MGSVLEFKKDITPVDVENAFNLPGGGIHKVTSG